MNDIPTLRTARLILRPMRISDFAPFAATWADPAVTQHILPEPRDETGSWRSFLMNAGSWAMSGIGQWAITLAPSDTYIGQTGFFDAKRGLGPDFDGIPECGWVIAPGHWGQGYAREAVGAAHDWFDAQGPAAQSRALITAGHARSERVAGLMGYRQFRVENLDGTDVGLYARVRSKA
jgi:RimJ/RimL family protein N-acetyltransferase